MLERVGGEVGKAVGEGELERHLAAAAVAWRRAMVALPPVLVGWCSDGEGCEAEGGGDGGAHGDGCTAWYAQECDERGTGSGRLRMVVLSEAISAIEVIFWDFARDIVLAIYPL